MRARVAAAAAIGWLVLAASTVRADPPHWESSSIVIDCSTCHVTHAAPGGALTTSSGNVNLCQSCHSPSGLASDLPMNDADKAVPGVSGISHGYDVPTVNADLSTQDPEHLQMQRRVMDGNLVCSTCHDQHWSRAAERGTSRIGNARRLTSEGSSGTLTAGGDFDGAGGLWYLIDIVTAGDETGAIFRYSKDNGTTWFPDQTAGTDVPLDNGVTVTFGAGSFAVGEQWEFAASWPMLREPADQGANDTGDTFCRDCHRSWAMDHVDTQTWDGNPKSHPVGIVMGANGKSYDRTIVLDGNGAEQGSGGADSNASNDLRFDAQDRVQCWTCHGIHTADSNTLTDDSR
jgi:predicted CXXCH cytochrome family protein